MMRKGKKNLSRVIAPKFSYEKLISFSRDADKKCESFSFFWSSEMSKIQKQKARCLAAMVNG